MKKLKNIEIKEEEKMKFEYLKPVLQNLSQGSRLAFVRQFRKMSQDEVADYFGFGGERPGRNICRYEKNDRKPEKGRLQEFAKLYDVNINAIKDYDYSNPIDTVYTLMWLEEQFPNYEIDLECSSCMGTTYNMNVQKAIREWNDMREKRKNREISYEEYTEWKLKFEIKGEIK